MKLNTITKINFSMYMRKNLILSTIFFLCLWQNTYAQYGSCQSGSVLQHIEASEMNFFEVNQTCALVKSIGDTYTLKALGYDNFVINATGRVSEIVSWEFTNVNGIVPEGTNGCSITRENAGALNVRLPGSANNFYESNPSLRICIKKTGSTSIDRVVIRLIGRERGHRYRWNHGQQRQLCWHRQP